MQWVLVLGKVYYTGQMSAAEAVAVDRVYYIG
jgi:hypothetical protein